jgi:catalase
VHTDSEAQRRWLATTPPSNSYATAPYFAVHTYLFGQADGAKRPARWIFEPVSGRAGLSQDEIKTLPDHFLADELGERLRTGPVQWRVLAMIPHATDPLHNPTVNWPETRETIDLGMLTVTALASAGSAADSEQMVFDPVVLPTGIEPAGDPIFDSRSEAYSVSATRRGL